MKNEKTFRPDRIFSYFRVEWLPLAFVTLSGLSYNIGLLATPWFEGRLAQCLADILSGSETAAQMALLVLAYILVTLLVQASRFIKRFYVRRFANNINRSMKQVLYANLVRKDKVELEQAGTGTLMTKAISDVDACAEGMRKFTTEIFDTGIALLAYAVMLLGYDWRLALLCLVFAPISYYIAEQMKTLVQRTGAANKESTGRLSAATLDLDGLTQAIYQALDQTEAELKDLGTDMRSFAQGTPETDIPAPVPPRPAAKPAAPSPEKPAERLRVKAKAQPVHHTAPAAPVHRLRNTRRPISQLLQDQIDKLGQEEQ